MVQSGDFAPELTFTSVVRSPGEIAWSHRNFGGQLTVEQRFGISVTRQNRLMDVYVVVDESGLEGFYDFHVASKGNNNEAFFQALRDALGLVTTAETREVAMLIVRQP